MSKRAQQLIKKEKINRTGKLDLGNCGLRKIPKEVFELTWLEELSFSNEIRNISELKLIHNPNISSLNEFNMQKFPSEIKSMINLKRFNFSAGSTTQWVVNNFNIIGNLKQLEFLDINSVVISDYRFLENLLQLKYLNLNNNNITDSSDYEFLRNLKQLEYLDLGSHQLKNCSFLKDLEKLLFLNLSNNKITDINFLKNLKALRSLNLSNNVITNCSLIKKLIKLEYLDLGSNKIVYFNFLKNLADLTSLKISANQISKINFLKDLTKLNSLDISSNQIIDFQPLKDLHNLRTLDIGSNQIIDSSFLNDLHNLTTLDISSNRITSYTFLESLTNLHSLKLRENHISDFSFLKSRTEIQYLDLSYNQINDISSIKELKSIKFLDLSHNQINDIQSIKELINLDFLDLNYNQINDIQSIKELTNLNFLDLSHNQINDIQSIKELTNLNFLDLSHNQINEISELLPLLNLENPFLKNNGIISIKISSNPLNNPPIQIINEGSEAVINWFEQMKDGETPLYETKLLILGQGNAGKTTFANLQLDSEYRVTPGKIPSTLGIKIHKDKEFSHINNRGEKIRTHLWDFGGQNIQKMLHQYFITENCLYVLVTDKRSENTNFDYWFQIINLLGPQSSVIVIENPIDIEAANEDFELTKYRELFNELDIVCFEINLKHTRSIEKTKWKLLNETIEKKLSELEIVNQPVPKKWILVRDKLEKLRTKKYISKDKFLEICSKPEIGMTKEQCELCLFYLKAIGELVYFDDRELCTHIFLDHNWLNKGMFYILADKKIQEACGRFTRKQAYDQWTKHGYNENEKAMLLNLLLRNKFDICYELISEPDVFITPLLLPSDKLTKWDLETNLYFRYQYGFIPHGLFSRLIVQLHEKIDSELRWKTGVRLIDNSIGSNIKAEIQQYNDPDDNRTVIDIKINGKKEGCKILLQFIRTAVEQLHKDFKNISCKEIVACNCEKCSILLKKGKKPSFYEYKKLQNKIQNRKFKEECGNSNYTYINIGQILNDVIIENAFEDNLDSELLYRLKKMGLSMTQIINKNELSNSGNTTNTLKADQKLETIINIDIKVITELMSETQMLKEDIEDERKLLQKELSDDEIDVAINDVVKAEEAIKEIETAQNQKEEPKPRSKKRLQRFMEELNDKDSTIGKAVNLLRRGKGYVDTIKESYNKLADSMGLPPVSQLTQEFIDKI